MYWTRGIKQLVIFAKQNVQSFCRTLIKLTIVVGASILCAPVSAQDKTIVNFCVPNSTVYPFFLNDQALNGINHDVVTAAFEHPKLANFELRFVKRPWKRCNMELKSGGIDMIVGGYEKSRDDVGVYPNELGFDNADMVFSTADVCFVTMPGEQKQKTLAGMQGEGNFNVGVVAGFSQDHKPDIAPNWVVIYNHLEKYRLLEKGRVDAIAQVCSMDKQPIATKAETSGFQNFETLQPPYLSNPAYIIYSESFVKRHADDAKLILQEVQKVNKPAIYSKYRSAPE